MVKEINHKAVVIAAILYQLVGFLWYQAVFSEVWQNVSGVTPEDIESLGPTPHFLALIGAFCFAYVFAFLQNKLKNKLKNGLGLVFLLWLGVTLPDSIPHYTFLSIPNTILILDTLHTLVAMSVAGIVIILWRK